MANILLLLDMQNLWDNCRAQYGKRAGVNFKNLLEKSKTKKNDAVTAVAFISCVPDKNQDSLIKKLDEYGIAVVVKNVAADEVADFSKEMLEIFEKELAACEKVVLGSNNTGLRSVIESANAANKETLILAFCNGLDKSLAEKADNIRLLGKNDTISQC